MTSRPAKILDVTTLTGSGKGQLVRAAQAVLERRMKRKLKAGDKFVWVEMDDGEVTLRQQ